jgi:nitroreductase
MVASKMKPQNKVNEILVKAMLSFIVMNSKISAWMENQTYLALGQLLFAAGLEGIDATPMEGFDRDTINQEFGLAEKGLKHPLLFL